MKKRILLIPLCVMALVACDHVISSSSQSTSSSSSATTEIVLPKTLEEIKSNFEKTEFNGYSFVDNENGEYKGTSTFKENEIFVKGNTKDDGATDEFVIKVMLIINFMILKIMLLEKQWLKILLKQNKTLLLKLL